MRLFSARDVRAHLPVDALVDAIEASFREHADGTLPPPERLDSYVEKGEFHVKAGHVGGFLAVKANSAFFGNPPERPAIQGLILLYDSRNGEPVAAAPSGDLTAMRTAAASAVAVRRLAAPDASTLGILGAGFQAWHHVSTIAEVRPIREVLVWSRTPASAERLAARVESELGLRARAVTAPAEAARADVIVTCTPATVPLLDVGDVTPGTVVAAVGADSPHKQELASRLTAASYLVPDVLGQAIAVGELHHAIEAGLMSEADIAGELGTLLGGADLPADRPVVFDSTGTGFQDAAAIRALVAHAPASVGYDYDLGGALR